MSKTIELIGQLVVGGGCADSCGGASIKTQVLGLRCAGSYFESVVSTDTPIEVSTPGAIGAAYVDLPVTGALDSIEFLYVHAAQPVRLLLGAGPAVVRAAGAVYPTGFTGGEGLALVFDGIAVNVTFTSGAQSAAQVAGQINAAAAIVGLAYLPASVSSGGQLVLSCALPGALGSVQVVSGTALAALGLVAGTAVGAGEVVEFLGTFLTEFGRGQPGAPSRVMVSGQARLEILAAGSPA